MSGARAEIRDQVNEAVSSEFRVVNIPIDSAEIVDRVDEMLAWLRIASQPETTYYKEAYRRAQPNVALGLGSIGRMAPTGVDVYERTGERPTKPAAMLVKEEIALVSRILPILGERPCSASLSESTDRSDQALLRMSGDQIDDCGEWANDQYNFSYYKDVKYHLEGIVEAGQSDRLWYQGRYRLPQSTRIFIYQNHAVFKDGRTSAGIVGLGYTDQTGLIDMVNQRPVAFSRMSALPFIAQRLAILLGEQWLRRDEWTVELAASPERTGIGLATDAIGAQALVAGLREKSDAPKRLVHWVSEHMRRRRGGGDPSTVRAHLRGKQAFRVGHYWATVYPSRADIERACNGQRFDLCKENT